MRALSLSAAWAPYRSWAACGGMHRLVDICLAATILWCLAPVMLVVALALLLEGGRPILFSQVRLGYRGHPFRLLKFRKFRVTEHRNLPVTVANDPRLTRVGRFLERSKLDELPQLWNVLRGEMAMVGPRPETPNFADCYTEADRWLMEYRPGIFGPTQALFRNEARLYQPGHDPEQFYREVLFPAKARVDLAYYSSRTLARDMGWMLRGMMAVVGLPATWRWERRP
jgi:lipopolysaccharide/colanic/teichoic acid biosynthesis glycosyltransferase